MLTISDLLARDNRAPADDDASITLMVLGPVNDGMIPVTDGSAVLGKGPEAAIPLVAAFAGTFGDDDKVATVNTGQYLLWGSGGRHVDVEGEQVRLSGGTLELQPRAEGYRAFAKARKQLQMQLDTAGFPHPGSVSITIPEFQRTFESIAADDQVTMAGLVTSVRQGKLGAFVDIASGHETLETPRQQVYISGELEAGYAMKVFRHLVKRDDFLIVRGTPFTTETGHQSLRAVAFRSVIALRETPSSLKDLGVRRSARHLEWRIDRPSTHLYMLRAKIMRTIRDYFEESNFLEVETPVLQSVASGAAARPFKAYFDAVGQDTYLRVAPELSLKRLLVGGFERVFEMARCFRNEGVSHQHNPEFTMLEWYEAWSSGPKGALRMLTLIGRCAKAADGFVTDHTDLKRLEAVQSQCQAHCDALEAGGLQFPVDTDMAGSVRAWLSAHDVESAEIDSGSLSVRGVRPAFKSARGKVWKRFQERYHDLNEMTASELLCWIWETVICKDTGISMVTGHPAAISPLAARQNEERPDVDGHRQLGYAWETTNRFEMFLNGVEISNGYSEINDAEVQEERFQQQLTLQDGANEEREHMHVDMDFVAALEYAMPLAGGVGIGLDRLIMQLAGVSHIRDVILFPYTTPSQ